MLIPQPNRGAYNDGNSCQNSLETLDVLLSLVLICFKYCALSRTCLETISMWWTYLFCPHMKWTARWSSYATPMNCMPICESSFTSQPEGSPSPVERPHTALQIHPCHLEALPSSAQALLRYHTRWNPLERQRFLVCCLRPYNIWKTCRRSGTRKMFFWSLQLIRTLGSVTAPSVCVSDLSWTGRRSI